VAEVRVIVDSVAGTEDCALIAGHIPRETDAGSEIVPVLVEEVAGTLETSIADLIKEALASRSQSRGCPDSIQVEVGVKVLLTIRAVQHAVIFPAQSRGEGEPRGQLDLVLKIESHFVVAVVPGEAGRLQRSIHGGVIGISGDMSPGIDGQRHDAVNLPV